MKILAAILMCAMLTGCVVYPYPADGYYYTTATVVYEPDIYVGPYYVGYYYPSYGYWTGYGWDVNFYYYGHSGYGHYYRDCPQQYYRNYQNGQYYRPPYYGQPYRPTVQPSYRPTVQPAQRPVQQAPVPIRPPRYIYNDRMHTDHTH